MCEIIDDKYFIIPLFKNSNIKNTKSNSAIFEIIVPYTEKSDDIHVSLELSKEAMIGFGTSLIRLYNKGFPENIDIRTEPLESAIGGNQPLGFWLTSNSATLYVCRKEFDVKGVDTTVKHKNESTIHKSKIKFNYMIDLEWDKDYLESYMLGFKNNHIHTPHFLYT